jgi:hypothetical protein
MHLVVAELEKYNEVEDWVFYDSTLDEIKTSAAYCDFLQLCGTASNAELKELLKHKSNVVKAYAFWALAIHHSPETYEVFKQNLNDTSTVTLRGMKGVYKIPLKEFYLDIIFTEEGNRFFTSYEVSPFQLSKEEEQDLIKIDTTYRHRFSHRMRN